MDTGHSYEQNWLLPTFYSPLRILRGNTCWKDQTPKSLIFPYFHGCQPSTTHSKFWTVSQEYLVMCDDARSSLLILHPLQHLIIVAKQLRNSSAHTLLLLLCIRNRTSRWIVSKAWSLMIQRFGGKPGSAHFTDVCLKQNLNGSLASPDQKVRPATHTALDLTSFSTRDANLHNLWR